MDAELKVRLQPRASREELIGFADGVLRARVTAPPVDGKANRALCRLLGKRLGVAPSRIRVVRGGHSREKLVRVDGIGQAAAEAALGGLRGGGGA